jgi:flagellar M-ring protein FliF
LNIVSLLSRLGIARVAAMGVVALLMIGFFAFLMFRVSSPQMAPLYTGLSFEDSAAIVTELQQQGAVFEIRGEGDTILVARDQITTLRMQLAESGLPQRGQVGYEIFDQQSALGTTSFVQNINNVRALEGELARTISSLARIKSARVHLVLPERELFRRERQDPSASIVLSVRGELSAGEIRAIQHLVASAIEGLTPARVSIIDDAGQLLASGTGNDENSVIAAEAEERTLGVENRLRTRLEDLLANVVGAGKARVQVAVVLDLERSTRTADTFDPDGQVVRSTQTREVANSSTDGSQTQGVTVGDELPGAETAADAAGSSREQGSTTEETTNFEISKTTETTINEAGGLKRLSVAVVVDGTYIDDGNGASTYQARTPEELEQIRALVQSAAGFDANRGDQVEVVNMQFAERPEELGEGTAEAGLFNFTRDDLLQGAELLVTLFIALALVFFVMRPLLKRVLSPDAGSPLALTGSGAAAGAQAGAPMMMGAPSDAMMAGMTPQQQIIMQMQQQPQLMQQPGGGMIAAPQAGGATGTPGPAAWLGAAQSLGATQGQTLKTVGNLVDENPKQAASIVRDWLSNAA